MLELKYYDSKPVLIVTTVKSIGVVSFNSLLARSFGSLIHRTMSAANRGYFTI